MMGPQIGGQGRVRGEEKALPEALGDPGGEGASDEEAAGDVLPDGGPVHDEEVADGGEAPGGGELLEQGAFVERHVHLGVALHGANEALLGLLTGLLDHVGLEEAPEEEGEEDDHQGSADELGRSELPADEDGEEDAELDDEVGGGELEGHCGGEVGALAEEGAGEGDGGVGARGGGGAEPGGGGEGARGVVGKEAGHLGLGDDGLDDGREGEAEDEGPEDLPEHGEGEVEGVSDCVDGVGDEGSGWHGERIGAILRIVTVEVHQLTVYTAPRNDHEGGATWLTRSLRCVRAGSGGSR